MHVSSSNYQSKNIKIHIINKKGALDKNIMLCKCWPAYESAYF
jgi:hypothetical protein